MIFGCLPCLGCTTLHWPEWRTLFSYYTPLVQFLLPTSLTKTESSLLQSAIPKSSQKVIVPNSYCSFSSLGLISSPLSVAGKAAATNEKGLQVKLTSRQEYCFPTRIKDSNSRERKGRTQQTYRSEKTSFAIKAVPLSLLLSRLTTLLEQETNRNQIKNDEVPEKSQARQPVIFALVSVLLRIRLLSSFAK